MDIIAIMIIIEENMNKRISYNTIESKFQSSKSNNYSNCQQYANKFYDELESY